MVTYYRSWKDVAKWSQVMLTTPDFGPAERDYKVEAAANFELVKDALYSGEEWYPLLKQAWTSKHNNLYNWRELGTFDSLANSQPRIVEKALAELWDEELHVRDRFRGFLSTVPTPELFPTSLISVLHLAVDGYNFPPFKPEYFKRTQKLLGVTVEKRESRTEQPGIYEDALEFLDRIIYECGRWDVQLRDRLDAQGFVWLAGNSEPWGLYGWDERTYQQWEEFIGKPVGRAAEPT